MFHVVVFSILALAAQDDPSPVADAPSAPAVESPAPAPSSTTTAEPSTAPTTDGAAQPTATTTTTATPPTTTTPTEPTTEPPTTTTATATQTTTEQNEPTEPTREQWRLVGYGSTAVVVAGVVTGVAFGALAQQSFDCLADVPACNKGRDDPYINGEVFDLRTEVQTQALVADMAFVVASVGVAVAATALVRGFLIDQEVQP